MSDAETHRPGRFLTLKQVAEELGTSYAQVYALVKDRSLTAIQIGGRAQWRVERAHLEDYIAERYRASALLEPTADSNEGSVGAEELLRELD